MNESDETWWACDEMQADRQKFYEEVRRRQRDRELNTTTIYASATDANYHVAPRGDQRHGNDQ